MCLHGMNIKIIFGKCEVLPERKRFRNSCMVHHDEPYSFGFQEYKRTKARIADWRFEKVYQ